MLHVLIFPKSFPEILTEYIFIPDLLIICIHTPDAKKNYTVLFTSPAFNLRGLNSDHGVLKVLIESL